MYTPAWQQYEEKLHTGTPQEQREALDAFVETRDRELAVSKKARDFETSRRTELAKYKPEFTKKRLKKEQEEPLKIIKELKDGGQFSTNLTPMPGYVVVELEKAQDIAVAGLYLASTEDVEPNRGTILACGEQLVMAKNVLNCPVKVGDRVLFKKFAGMDMLVKGKDCRLMQFTDLLARFDD